MKHLDTLRVLMALVAFFLFTVHPRADEEKKSVVVEMKRSMFLAKLKVEARQNFCSEEGILKCFSVPKAKCIETYDNTFNDCARAAKVPDPIQLTGVDQAIGDFIGDCLGREFAKRHEKTFRKGAECVTRK